MPTIKPARRVAVIGAGPSGAITVDALVRENCFTSIRVFERREGPGGCWIGDNSPPPPLTNLSAIAARQADPPLPVPTTLPTRTPRIAAAKAKAEAQVQQQQARFAESSIYPYLETNVDDGAMCFTGGGLEAIPARRSEWSVAMHGEDTPFRHWTVMRDYVAGLFGRNGYEGLVSYGASVERVEKKKKEEEDEEGGEEWLLTVRREEGDEDVWTEERFDAVVVASGHFNVPWIPAIEGLEEFESARMGSVLHSKMFRGREAFRGKRVVVVGASVSGADIAYDLATHQVTKDDGIVHAIVLGHNYNGYFGDEAFHHPRIKRHPSIARIDAATRTVHLIDGTSIPDVDHLIFGTGYSWSLPFLQQQQQPVAVRNNRVPGLYQHVVWQADPTLLFVGAVGAGLTFKIFEWQAVYAARVLAGRGQVPTEEEMRAWEEARVKVKGDGPAFQMVYPDFEEYFEKLRALAGPPTEKGEGRTLPPFDEGWVKAFMDGHERRKAMWRRLNAQARRELEGEEDSSGGQAVQSRI
ncbi:hypothetical protein N0V82_010822 [Gnomoniopsis sp. IMI 355080]|nr:hypothetical protein N0V82_010822 [Gnomoniopsis sp. IMI 355080]